MARPSDYYYYLPYIGLIILELAQRSPASKITRSLAPVCPEKSLKEPAEKNRRLRSVDLF